jgi:6,7-dimethyl-8-ribityllumazine synthase
MNVIEGRLEASGLRFGIVVSRFNEFVTERLLEGATGALLRSGAAAADITVVRVPGAWELPQTAAALIRTGSVDAVIALGCLIRGDTIHFDLIAGEVAKGLGTLGRESGTPVILGVLTTDTLEQAVQRVGAKLGNKGAEAAQAAVEQVHVVRSLARRTQSSATLTNGAPAPRTKTGGKPRARQKARKRA